MGSDSALNDGGAIYGGCVVKPPTTKYLRSQDQTKHQTVQNFHGTTQANLLGSALMFVESFNVLQNEEPGLTKFAHRKE
jgi:hypothetical protein